MNPDGQRGNPNPTAKLAALISKRERFQDELCSVEKQVYELETRYLQDSSQFGNAFKGFEGFLSSAKNTSNVKRPRKLQPEDRIFSLSSVTSPAVSQMYFPQSSIFPGIRSLQFKMIGIFEVDSCIASENARAEELGLGRDDGRSDYGTGRPRGGSLPSNAQGKPKKGRIASMPRDAKRNRPSSEPEFDDEDE